MLPHGVCLSATRDFETLPMLRTPYFAQMQTYNYTDAL